MIDISPAEIRFLLVKLGFDGPSIIRPDPNFTAQDALALAERLKNELRQAGK